MKIIKLCFLLAAISILAPALSPARADQTTSTAVPAEFRAQFFQLCDLAAAKLIAGTPPGKGPFFVDSYAVRALCAAYDGTGNANYLNACRVWSERMVKFQEQMTPAGAYYMNYNRKPGETNGDWYAADSSSIGMAVLATSVRCQGAEQKRFLNSARRFANLVIKNYLRPDGGVSDGLWSKSSESWWCSSGLFGSFAFNLYAHTGDKRYLKAALGATDWLNHLDLTKDQPFPLSQQGPAMVMYVLENYSAGWPFIVKNDERKQAALAKVSWCFNWIAEQQAKPPRQRQWPPTVGWGMKFGGLPFHEYIFSNYLPDGGKWVPAGDAELQQLAPIVFTGDPKLTQLPMFMLMSYAERLEPGKIYRNRQ
jgi:hypothetical protein